MDVVVRTPHGDADIEIVSAPGTTTLGDLLTAVTGQAPPATARVDDRVTNASQPLTTLGLTIGSVIDARTAEHPATEARPNETRINLLQLTGRGAGSINTLPFGRYRVGSGRRLNADEMADAPVEHPAFEIRIDRSGSVTVSPGPRIGGPLGVMTPTLDGELFDRELRWTSGRLNVGGRLFQLETPALTPPRRTLPPADDRGAIPFQRPPRSSSDPDLLAVSARRRAASASQGLWARRRTDPGAFTLPFGILPDDETAAVVDLQRHRGVALVGSDRFGVGLARTLIVEAVTRYGPSDLDLVIASTPERLGRWDWAKWLPHIRRGDPSARPALFAERPELEIWASSVSGATPPDPFTVRRQAAAAPGEAPNWNAPVATSSDTVTTVLLLDDIALWSQRDSPLRSVLVDPPADLRIIALCGGLHEAPGMCTALIEERLPIDVLDGASDGVGSPSLFGSLATLHLRIGQSPEVVSDIRPAFVEPSVAHEIAASLAALDDLEVSRSPEVPTQLAPPSLAELVEMHVSSEQPTELTVTLGLIDEPVPQRIGSAPQARRPMRVDLARSRVTLLSAADREAHDTLVAATILGASASRRVDQLAVLTVGSTRPAWHSEVPHIAGHVDRSATDDPARLVHRVAHVLTQRSGLEVLVVIEDAFSSAPPTAGRTEAVPSPLLTGMLELAASLSRVHVVMTTEFAIDTIPAELRERCGIEVHVAGDTDDPRGTVTDHRGCTQFIGPIRVSEFATAAAPAATESTALVIRPNVFGRSMSPLERRVARATMRVSSDSEHDPATQQIAQRIAAEAAVVGGTARPSDDLLPPPLATTIHLAALLESHPGPAIPLGLLDRPERADSAAYWWEPGQRGSLLAIGGPRSGMTHLGDLLAIGIASRVSADDLHVYAIEPLPQRRRAFDALPHSAAVVSTDDPNAVMRVISTVIELLAMRRSDAPSSEPGVLLFIGDLARLARWLPDDDREEVFESLATIGSDGAAVGINIVCVTTRVDDLGPLDRLVGDRLVGMVSGGDDRSRLGVPMPGLSDRHAGRCWSVDADRRVQLATPPDSVEHAVANAEPERARRRPPERLVERGHR